ncbi:MAG TPA: hypothetical protein PL028_08750, partial [Bacteroidales bacterium]|nr:hypothetical protein [Bacteroidales bacterium]
DIEYKSHLSKYFQVVEFSPSFTAGKNSFSFNGTDFLKDGTEIKMQVLDSERNSLYIDSPPMEIHYIDLANFTTAIHINKETVGGPGKIILVGTTVKDEIVRWIGNIYIDIASTNLSRVRFYKEPTLEINSLIYPVVSGSTDYGSSQEGTSHLVTITGNFVGRDYLMGKSVTRGGTYYTIQTDDFTLDPLLYPTASFNSQMVGQNIELYITHISTKSQVAGTFGEKIEVNSTQSFKVSQIQQYNKLKLDRNVISPLNGEVVRECLGRFKATYVFIDDNIRSNYQAKASGSVLAQGYCGTGAVTPPLGSVIPNNFDYNTLDYRVYIAPQWAKLFDSSMNGKIIELHTTYLRYEPGGEIHIPYSSTQSFTIKKVLDTGTLQTTMPFTKYQGKPGQYPIADIMWAWYEVKDTPTTPTPSITTTASLATSYAEIVYRNLTTFSGFVSRHKLFMNSLIYSPPQWEVIIDEEISNKEMLMDPLASKASQYIGGFYSQQQIKKYWIQNNSDFLNVLKYTNIPDAMIISSVNDYSLSDGNQYVIMKTAAPGVVNDSNYYPFDKECHRNLSGSSYSSNPLHLYKDTLYVLSVPYARLLNSSSDTEAKVSFYFTSSTPSIIGEPAYSKQYGLKIGELFSDINESMTVFENQLLFFTPKEDYFGTLVIVPYHSDFI